MRGGLVLGAIAVLFLMPALGLAQEPISREIPALLTADEVSYDETLGVVVASGHVEISQGQRVLLADTVTYNQRTNVVTASGNVSLLEPSGEVIFADYAELTDDMREGLMRSTGILLTDRSRFAAVSGWRSGGNRLGMPTAVVAHLQPRSQASAPAALRTPAAPPAGIVSRCSDPARIAPWGRRKR